MKSDNILNNETVELLCELSYWMDKYIVDTPEKIVDKDACILAQRLANLLPTRHTASRKPDTFVNNDK